MAITDPVHDTTALVTEHLQYTPLSLIDDIINAINTIVYKAVTAVENGLLNAPPESLGFSQKLAANNAIPDTDGEGNAVYPEAKGEIENGVHQLETLLEATVDKDFDKLEIYVLRNVLTVPEDLIPWIRLAHYEGLSLKQEQDSPTPESLHTLRRKLQETQMLQIALLQESSQNAALISQLQHLLDPSVMPKRESSVPAQQEEKAQSPFSFLTSHPAAQELELGSRSQHAPLTTNTAFALSQLPALRSLLSILRPKLSHPPGTNKSESVAQQERRHYIESQTRRHLERTRGLELGHQGEVRDGEWQGGGRSVGAEEVTALERVVGIVGGQLQDEEMDVDQ